MSDEPRDGQSDGTADHAGDPRRDGANPAAAEPSSSATLASDPHGDQSSATASGPAAPSTPAPSTLPGTLDPGSSVTGTPATGAATPAADAPVEDGRTDGTRTDVSAPWERPQRWRRTGLDADRVDALLARLGDDAPDSRRTRRKNNDDSDAVPASALIAALGESTPEDAAPDQASAGETAGGERSSTEPPAGQGAPDEATPDETPATEATAGEATAGEAGRPVDSDHAAPAGDQLAGDDAAELPADDAAELPADGAENTATATAGRHEDGDAENPTSATADRHEDGDAENPTSATADRHEDGDAHTGPLPRSDHHAAELAEASSIRAALDRRAGVRTVRDTPAAGSTSLSRSRRKAAAAGTTLVHGSNRPRHRGLLYAGRTIAALLALVTLIGIGWNWKIKDRAEAGLVSHSIQGPLPTADPSISTARSTAVVTTNSRGVTTTEAAPPKTVYKPENILLLGSDTRAGGNAALGGSDESTEGVANSDTLMVAHISGDREHVTVLSIPRDTIITTPACRAWSLETGKFVEATPSVHGGRYSHINTLYAVGGPQCTAAGVQSLTGLGITRIIGIDFDGFKAMVDALGGITVNVCKPIQDAVLGTVVAAGGVQVIKGQQAISLVRARDVIGDTQSDLARIRRQQVVLSAILRQVTQAGTLLNPVKLDGFLQAFVNNTFTLNVKLDDLITLAGSLGTLDPGRVTFYTLPTKPSTTIDGALDVDRAKALPVFDDLVNDLPLPGEVTTPAKPKPAATSTAPAPPPSLKLTVAPSKVPLELYNVSGRDNVAGMAQQELNASGFSIDDNQLFKPQRTQTATQVQFAPANRAAALTVAASVPGSTLVVVPGLGNTVRLQLGSSFAGVVKAVAVGQQAPASLATAISTAASIAPTTTAASTALSSVNAGAGTCA